MEMRDHSSEHQPNGLYKSDIVIQFTKDRQFGMNGTQCQVYVNPITNVEFEVSKKCVNGFDKYQYTSKNHVTNSQTSYQRKDIIVRLWMYCIGVILIAIGLSLIVIGTIANSKGSVSHFI